MAGNRISELEVIGFHHKAGRVRKGTGFMAHWGNQSPPILHCNKVFNHRTTVNE